VEAYESVADLLAQFDKSALMKDGLQV